MILVFDDVIINMDNVALIEAKEKKSDDSVNILIATTAIRFYPGDIFSGADHTHTYAKEFTIKIKKWHELIKAIQSNEKVFFLNERINKQ